ncbi:DUF2793 domain-containing protein [Shimia sagamensis]|uniref:Phage tail protein C-terminal domain-containing protein n=1 Tax=Shimia sagamensis TaxID=1566352 RepID=A0ABY1NBW8_9RHOB|nr:DUF2793 domain-containing protein [Shimia sagamensis]SMP05597.1 Protein of unknown function [Shimia sagamensis]
MSEHSSRLSLPFIMPSQAQKHVTHNEALQILDMLVQPVIEAFDATDPPLQPDDGTIWALGVSPTAGWLGHGHHLATWTNGAWLFMPLQEGFKAVERGSTEIVIWDGTIWKPAEISEASNLNGVGVNTGFDTTNRLSVSSQATLLTHEGAGHQVKVNKATDTDTASLLFQTNWSGRAEIGTSGSDEFSIKVSPDGSSWTTGLKFDATTGIPVAPEGLEVNGVIAGTAVTQSNMDSTEGRILKVGDGGVLGNAVQVSGGADLHTRDLACGNYVAVASVTDGLPETAAYWHSLMMSPRENGFLSGIAIRNAANLASQRCWFGTGGTATDPIVWTEFWHKSNTTVDTNGFVKEASPIVRLSNSGIEEPADPLNANFSRLSAGQYQISNVPPLAVTGWQIEVPQDANGNRIVFVDAQYDATDQVLNVTTSHVAWDGGWTAGAAKDIPENRWVDLRFVSKDEDDGEL